MKSKWAVMRGPPPAEHQRQVIRHVISKFQNMNLLRYILMLYLEFSIKTLQKRDILFVFVFFFFLARKTLNTLFDVVLTASQIKVLIQNTVKTR